MCVVVVLQAMQCARCQRRKDYDVTTNDDEIIAMIDKMRQAASVRFTYHHVSVKYLLL